MHVPAKSVTVAVCAIGLAISAWLLLPTAASAQFNIPGIVFGGMNYHYGNGAYRGHHRRVHESKHERRHKGDDEETGQGSGTNGKSDPVPDNKSVAAAPDKKPAPAPAENQPAETASTGAPASAGAPAASGGPAAAGAPAATNNDQPSFSPSR
jgi:hypothetical protein